MTSENPNSEDNAPGLQTLDQVGRPVTPDYRTTPTEARPADEDPSYHGLINWDDDLFTAEEIMADLPDGYEEWTLTQAIGYGVAYKKLSDSLREKAKLVKAVQDKRVHEADVAEAIRQLTRAAREAGRSLERQAIVWATEGDAGQQRQANLYVNNTPEVK